MSAKESFGVENLSFIFEITQHSKLWDSDRKETREKYQYILNTIVI